ncbi:hypothetical protein GH714_043856 [Hevea brasiliensis]|uniref:Exocyst subunit Exo70 family protein n=1 Tax=Hevea brasiliensis TaxID=3981 RepID=A0A6A6K0Y8_HEVBR|nr:hypothetical protein GH714_043856 [Hevea brasiliensis]
MCNCQSIMPSNEAEQHIIAATQHILKALGASKNLSDEFKRVLTELDSHLSTMIITETEGGRFSEIEEQLKHAERKIIRWESDPCLIWDSGPMEATEYLQAVNEILIVIESLGEGVFYDESFASVEDEIVDETYQRDGEDRESAECYLDLVDPCVIPNIKSIANVMSASNYIQEFCEAFIDIQREALYEYLSVLEMEKLSIEDVLKLEWDCLSRKIKKWIWIMKVMISVYLASEKRLCDQILGDFGSFNSFCFIEISKDSVLCLLNFGQAITTGPQKPEKLFRCLTCGIHPLVKYVMNYMRLLPDYCDTFNLLLKDQDIDESNAVVEIDNGQDFSSSTSCPMAYHLRSIASSLESNLIDKSKLYKDDSLQYFLDEQHPLHGQKVVSVLRDDGKTNLKERYRRFSIAFEEVYKNQTRWCIPDLQLREDLQISTSQKVIPAYRNFVGINNSNVSDKHVKYTTDDLEELLLDLFVGSPRSLHNSRRR